MFPHVYGKLFQTPADFIVPEDVDLESDTIYPNLNSRDFANRPHNTALRMHTAWEGISLNKEQQVIIATNKLQGLCWNSTFWGFECVDDLDPKAACFQSQNETLTSQIKYVSKNTFIIALQSGTIQVWSTRPENFSATTPYCLFQIGEQTEHYKPIVCMDCMKTNENKATTASKDGTLKIWDMGQAYLCSTHTFAFAHTDVITGVDTSNRHEDILATCSLDKNALLWDIRLTKPATAIFEKHKVRFKAVAWSSPTHDSDENYIYLGDECGFLYTVDKRRPKEFVNTTEVFDRPLRKILVNGENIAVIGDTNQVKIYAASATTAATAIYENSDSENFVRDAVWSSPTSLYTVGYEGKLRKHNLNSVADSVV